MIKNCIFKNKTIKWLPKGGFFIKPLPHSPMFTKLRCRYDIGIDDVDGYKFYYIRFYKWWIFWTEVPCAIRTTDECRAEKLPVFGGSLW